MRQTFSLYYLVKNTGSNIMICPIPTAAPGSNAYIGFSARTICSPNLHHCWTAVSKILLCPI